MRFLKENIVTILIVAGAVAVTALCFVIFYKPKSASDEAFKDKMEMYDQMLKREQEFTNQERERSDKIIDELLKQDSVKQQQVKVTKQRINETPNRINNLDREPFRREFTEF